MKYFISLLSSVLFFSVTQAQSSLNTYAIDQSQPVSGMIKFSIPYTFGTHHGIARSVEGFVQTDASERVLRSQFKLPIQSLTTGNKTRDCHMLEALGLDYSQSLFPQEHVCDSNDQLPATGRDSIQYPDILVEFVDFVVPPESPIRIGAPSSTMAKLKLTIHGIERTQEWPVMVTKKIAANGTEGFQVTSRMMQSLKDFNVIVKGFGPINVKDQVTIQLDLHLVGAQ